MQNVATREEDAAAESPVENAATPFFAADESVAAANPNENVASSFPAVPPTKNIASEYSTSYPTEAVVDMDSDMTPIVDLNTTGLRRSPRIAAQNFVSAHASWFTSNTIMKCFCVFRASLYLKLVARAKQPA